jgi:hypothetical protein
MLTWACALQVTKNSADYANGESQSNPSVSAGVGSTPWSETLTPADGVSDPISYTAGSSSSGESPPPVQHTVLGAHIHLVKESCDAPFIAVLLQGCMKGER